MIIANLFFHLLSLFCIPQDGAVRWPLVSPPLTRSDPGREIIAEIPCHLRGREVCQPWSSHLHGLCIHLPRNSSCPKNWLNTLEVYSGLFQKVPLSFLSSANPGLCPRPVYFICGKVFFFFFSLVITLCRNCLHFLFAVSHSYVFSCFKRGCFSPSSLLSACW